MKPTRVHSQRAIDERRLPYCEVCGRSDGLSVHHCVSRGSGGPDAAENLICVCRSCHALAHAGHLSKDELWQVIASREGRPIEEIREACLEARRRAHTGE
jgi:hypothetical protein